MVYSNFLTLIIHDSCNTKTNRYLKISIYYLSMIILLFLKYIQQKKKIIFTVRIKYFSYPHCGLDRIFFGYFSLYLIGEVTEHENCK